MDYNHIQQAPYRSEEISLGSQEISSELKEKVCQFLKVAPERVIIEDCNFVLWNDSSLGCGEKGKMYLHVITPGYAIRLQVDGNRQVLHTNESGTQIIRSR